MCTQIASGVSCDAVVALRQHGRGVQVGRVPGGVCASLPPVLSPLPSTEEELPPEFKLFLPIASKQQQQQAGEDEGEVQPPLPPPLPA